MNDRYMFHKNVVDRLIREYNEHGSLIIAYDFDYTIHNHKGENDACTNIMDLLRELKPFAKFIVYTCSPVERYQYIKGYLDMYDLPYDTINENIIYVNDNPRAKLYFNAILDDRASLESMYFALVDFLKTIKGDI